MSVLGFSQLLMSRSGTFKRSITIDHTKCGSVDSADFPVLVSVTHSTLKSIANGGNVYRSDGYDINFFSDAGFTTLLRWEVENYNPVTGTLIAWVKVPAISATVDTTFYMQYGSGSISSFQGGATGSTWDANFKMVLHLGSPTIISATDKTSNSNNGTVNGTVSPTTGKIYGAATFNGNVANYISSSYQLPTTNFTYSFWATSSVSNVVGNRPVSAADFIAGTFGTGLIWGYSSTNQLYTIFRQGVNTGGGDITSAPASGLGSGWHHVVVVMNSTTGGFVYYDGALIGSNSTYKNITVGPATVTIGREYNQNSGAFTGSVDEVRVSNTVRTIDWIITEYNNQNSPGNIGSSGFLSFSNEF